MKIEKIIKYLFVTPVVLFFMCVLFATPVKAESNDTYIFTVPTNTVSYYSFMKDMSKLNILQMIKENGDERKEEDAKKMKQI